MEGTIEERLDAAEAQLARAVAFLDEYDPGDYIGPEITVGPKGMFDITTVENTPIDYLDFASPVSGLGGKLGLDATNKIAGESNREWGKEINMDDEVVKRVSDMWEKLGLSPDSNKPIWK